AWLGPSALLSPLADAIPPDLPTRGDWFGPWTIPLAVAFLLASLLLIFWRWPMVIAWPVLLLFTRTIYRLRVTGQHNIPATGPALVVCNHVTYVDWLWLLTVSPRFIRFLIYAPYAEIWGVRTLLRWARVIPIDATSGPRAIVKALQAASEALANGEVVGIFAEGALTRTG